MSDRHAQRLDELSRELDMLVYRLEQKAPEDADALARERKQLRRALEKARDELTDIVHEM